MREKSRNTIPLRTKTEILDAARCGCRSGLEILDAAQYRSRSKQVLLLVEFKPK